MDFLGIGALMVIVVIGSLVFWVCLQNSIIINPSLTGFFSWWLSCLVGTAVVLYLIASIFIGAISWAIDFIEEYYLYMIGIIGIFWGLAKLGNKKDTETVIEKMECKK